MSAEVTKSGWRRWREAVFATCTAWLVVQNVGLLALLTWGRPAEALAAGGSFARTAATWGGLLISVFIAAAAGLALSAWLVHAPAEQVRDRSREVSDGR